ncbi:HlyD family type I secretion periplasmic adaptor subunit [Pararhizobium sp. IMCC21322]|uniref:HlyD family type I secretion periplasmic adaptor subunit n=1 Tax=Pararhizobium sp. IMCC21322 TaxID=3067903 RepID=UPI00274122CA|nr:HlyD family type I secretion periplasmic adaptor subunit [Pararhizobium sp. IMCC21322]
MMQSSEQSMKRYQRAGGLAIILVLGSLGAWATLSSISGAVIASGTIVVESNTKRIQHLEGGIVAEILVEEGDTVAAGDPLLRIDSTDAQAELSILDAARLELLAKIARLRAERDFSKDIVFDEDLLSRQGDPEMAALLLGQRRLLQTQNAAIQGRLDQLEERIAQYDDEIKGLVAQRAAKDAQTAFITEELVDIKSLSSRGLVPKTRVLSLQREQARLGGESGQLSSEMARISGRISETRLQAIQITDDFRARALDELRDAEAQLSEYRERRLAVSARLRRTEIVAPRSGLVHELLVTTIGAVLAPGETVMQLVPEGDPLVVEARVRPQDIDQISTGQTALLQFPNADSRLTPQINGEVIRISADLNQPGGDVAPFYTVRLRLAEAEETKLGPLVLRPGMPVEAFLQTSERSPLNYFLKPFSDQLRHAFREK